MLLYIISLITLLKVKSEEDTSSKSVENCRERNRLISTEKGDLYALVDAALEEKLILHCHYCREQDDSKSKIWYIIDVFGLSKPEEVKIDMENEDTKNRIQISSDHSLTISNLTYNDTGVYFCMRFEQLDNEEKISYLVDLVEEANISNIETGNETIWLKYHEDNMYPINYLFKNSLSPEYVYIREKLKLSLELKSDWESWGPCEVCGRPKDEGIKKRIGRCRIKIDRIEIIETYGSFTADEIFLLNAFEISCRSLLLKKLTPTIFNSTRIVPDFTEIHHCEGICNPDAEGANAGWKVGKAKSFKYRKTVVMSEGDHLTLICPESTLEHNVIWKKNGMELKRGESVKPEKSGEEPRILVDTFSTLYLVEVTSTEEGNYTCLVDNIKMERVIIFIVSKSRLFSTLFVRHLLYLGFVLSLTLTCYIGGVVVACRKRYTFKTYKMLKTEAKESGTEDSDEDEEDSF